MKKMAQMLKLRVFDSSAFNIRAFDSTAFDSSRAANAVKELHRSISIDQKTYLFISECTVHSIGTVIQFLVCSVIFLGSVCSYTNYKQGLISVAISSPQFRLILKV